MNDPPARMRGFEAKSKFALAVAIERHAAPDQFVDRGRRGFEDRARGRLVAKAVGGGERTLDDSNPSGALLRRITGRGAKERAAVRPARPPPTMMHVPVVSITSINAPPACVRRPGAREQRSQDGYALRVASSPAPA